MGLPNFGAAKGRSAANVVHAAVDAQLVQDKLSTWGFRKIMGTCLGAPIARIIIFCDL